MFLKKFIFIIIISQLLSACIPISGVSPSQKWSYADLRSLSKPGDIPPYYDLIAVYTRNAGTDFQIRLDFLDLDSTPKVDIYLALDTQVGGTDWLPLGIKADLQWDTLLVLAADGSPQALKPPGKSPISLSDLQPRHDLIPRILRDPYMDNVVVSLNRASLAPPQPIYHLQVFVAPAGENLVVDSLGPLSSEAFPPPQTPVLLAFWNTFPAFTPAQALRRWDGAHTGPFGERHGLQVLLSAVRRNQVPVILLDLKSPASLSALDYIEAFPKIRALLDDKLLVLPDAVPDSLIQLPVETLQPATTTLPGAESTVMGFPSYENSLPDWAQSRAIAEGRQISLRFGLQVGRILYTPYLTSEPPDRYSLIFTPLNENQPVLWKDWILIPLPSMAPQFQPSIDGPTIDLRRAMLENAASGEPGNPPLIILGGDLPKSAWGDPESAEMTLRYIANHPWIKPLNIDDLMSMRNTVKVMDFSPQVLPVQLSPQTALVPSCSSLIDQLNPSCSFPRNAITQAAWQAYLALFASLPQNPPITPAIRTGFIGQIKEILFAAGWAADPVPQITCDVDPDQDGQPECILASKSIFGLIELDGARLAYLFALSPTGAHQLVGPSTQFFINTSDLSAWDTTGVSPKDPNSSPGAFTEYPHPVDQYTPTLATDRISFVNIDSSLTKTFRLTDQGIQVTYHSASWVTSQIPLAIDPWRRFDPNWGNQLLYEKIEGGWAWGYQDGPRLEITSSSDLGFSPFTASRTWLNLPENPNADYPPGHFLPFPMALLELHAFGDYQVQINFSP